jgi:phosphoribosylformylglycinamidine synthase
LVRRVYVEKKEGFNVEARQTLNDMRENLGIKALSGLRIFNRYDISGISDEEYESARTLVFSEPPADNVYDEALPDSDGFIFAVEYLPGQYDQRADSAAQCVQLLTQGERPKVKVARVYVLFGDLSSEDISAIISYCINPVDSRQASLDKPNTLYDVLESPPAVSVLDGFINMDKSELLALWERLGMAMSLDDLEFCRDYFASERRNPTITEMRVIDTYWSDHCRHTTFLTRIEKVEIEPGEFSNCIKSEYDKYIAAREKIGRADRDINLMDMATICMREAKAAGLLDALDESEEINACSIKADITVNGEKEQWLIMFKNETHNHPTEIEPFGGAATCLGGAIRDPLSGRSYVYQAMRVTGAGNILESIHDTMEGKLPQRTITTQAAKGYSSYGNQIGLATGIVDELYHEGYKAKRMEIGAVIAAAPAKNVVRERPAPGDAILLIGGRTGRDGCGGATGSSKAHDEESIESGGAEVQKGNPITERKLQRLFRDAAFSRLIKRCNDFGAGGVCVAIGELADGILVNLDSVPKKYEGLDGTELAISESQERMAVVVDAKNAQRIKELAALENLEATVVAEVTGDARMVMHWRGDTIVNISRDFLNTNGVTQKAEVLVKAPAKPRPKIIEGSALDKWKAAVSDLNGCSKQGMAEIFDSTVGAATVLMPFGGKTQLTPAKVMAAHLPVLHGHTDDGTLMSFGIDPHTGSWSPFHGGMNAVVYAAANIVAAGGDIKNCFLSLQEYFERLGNESERWGKPFAALLGAQAAQRGLKIAAIGGKDSMSGSFNELDVPPTICAFAVCPADMTKIVSPEFKAAGNILRYIKADKLSGGVIDFEKLLSGFNKITDLISKGKAVSAAAVGIKGVAHTIATCCFGNTLGVELENNLSDDELFGDNCGGIIIELLEDIDIGVRLGRISERSAITAPDYDIPVIELQKSFTGKLDTVFPTTAAPSSISGDMPLYSAKSTVRPKAKIAAPRVVIPVSPGTNCEYDSLLAFERAGAKVQTVIIRNLTPADIEDSIKELANAISNSQIIMLPGGFSGGDEPDGSGKFIATMFRNPRISDAVTSLMDDRDGLILGICNGFQALIKLGLVPYGRICDMTPDSPTLTFNTIGRHVSRIVNTRVTSVLSPWLSLCEPGQVHAIPVSHGEGRFIGQDDEIARLFKSGQIATQYVGEDGVPSAQMPYNPNGSMYAVEGLCSPDGRILGKMGHSERYSKGLYINVPGDFEQHIFKSGVEYFS